MEPVQLVLVGSHNGWNGCSRVTVCVIHKLETDLTANQSLDEPEIFRSLQNDRQMTFFHEGTSSTQTFNIIRKWMSQCESDHDRCCNGKPRIEGNKNLKGIRFLHILGSSVMLEDASVPNRYACLSHCWGDVENHFKTTRENKAVHMSKGILVEELPKTYKDAVVVCKELGISYLWIDSICIIQNSEQDWNEQASRMADIYENAYITIAAVAARNSTEGLFNTISDRPIALPLRGYPLITVRPIPPLPNKTNEFMNTLTNDGHALYKRGWVYQELSLSARVIHYGREEVLWQCREKKSREGDPDGSPRFPDLIAANLDASISTQKLWYSIVESYSWRSLTFEKDRLPAIAAFASRIQAQDCRKKYVHGLWEDTLHFDLLWSVKNELCVTAHKSETERLPTWSWTSTRAPINWSTIRTLSMFMKVPYTQITGVTYNTRGPPILGDVLEAAITMKAPLVKLCDIPLVKLESRSSKSQRRNICWCFPYFDVTSDRETHEYRSREIIGVPLTMMRKDKALKQYFIHSNALLVVETSTAGVYQRVGVATINIEAALTFSPPDDEMFPSGKKLAWNPEMAELHDRFMQIIGQMEIHHITLI
jgi:hypothetical protein